jgi:hypothetical protein
MNEDRTVEDDVGGQQIGESFGRWLRAAHVLERMTCQANPLGGIETRGYNRAELWRSLLVRSGGAASWFVQRLRARRHLAGSRVVSPSASGDPVFIPHDVETRGVLTRIDRSRIPRSVIHFRLRRR